uniref:Dermokine n=1 Tax=Otolemur garnettii TaxID=30611 RepID=H0WIQ3_OTOGA
MKLLGSLPCLLLALCLGSGKAGPLQGGAGINVGEAVGHGVGDALSQGLGQALGHEAGGAASSAAGQGFREAAGSAAREATDALGNKIGEAAHSLGNGGREAARQVENALQHGADAAHGSWQGMPGSNGAWEAEGGKGLLSLQGTSGGHGIGNVGGAGTPWGHGFPGSSSGSFGTQGGFGGPGGNGLPPNTGANVQGSVAQPGYDSVRGSSQNTGCTNPPPSGSGGSSSNSGGSSGSQSGSSGSQSGSSGSQSGSNSGRGGNSDGSSGTNWQSRPLDGSEQSWGSNTGSSSSGGSSGSGGGHKPECENPGNGVRMSGGSGGQNSEMAPGLFNFESFWKNFKSKLGFINWDAIDKSKIPPPSTRARLYFHRLWEEFKSNTPFFNWKAITEGADPSLQKRAGGADQNHVYGQQVYPTPYNWQYPPKTPAKGGVTPPSSSASRVQPSLLHWMKFW